MSVCLTQANTIAVIVIVSVISRHAVDKSRKIGYNILVSLAGADCIAKQ